MALKLNNTYVTRTPSIIEALNTIDHYDTIMSKFCDKYTGYQSNVSFRRWQGEWEIRFKIINECDK